MPANSALVLLDWMFEFSNLFVLDIYGVNQPLYSVASFKADQHNLGETATFQIQQGRCYKTSHGEIYAQVGVNTVRIIRICV